MRIIEKVGRNSKNSYEINVERVMNDFSNIVKYTKTPGRGYTRFSYSSEDKYVRNYLISQMKQLDLEVRVDAIGNIRAKYGKQIKKPSIMIGSHIDTVKNGGMYDGLTGVLASLEIIRVLKEEEVKLSHSIELIIFAEEEGSNFGITLFGSKVLTGSYDLKELKLIKNENGESVYKVAKEFGLSVENIKRDILKKGEVDAMIELHIEQGIVLEKEKKSIGIVKAIAEMKAITITIEGESNHAGTTPMNLRSDPMVGASKMILYIQEVVKQLALPTTVATVGRILCEPNKSNVIPQKVEFSVDIRDVNPEGIKFILDMISQKLEEVSNDCSLKSHIETIGDSKGGKLSPRIIELIEKTARESKYNYIKMNSGAVHDAIMLKELTDVGMIFIPSVGGKSHCPEEHTNKHDIKIGCDLLLKVVKSLATR